MLKKITRRSLKVIIVIVVLANIWPIGPFLRIVDMDYDHYSYRNYNGKFTFSEMPKGSYNVDLMLRRWEGYKKDFPDQKNDKVYRLFWKNPLAFWRWWDYLKKDKRYDLPYFNKKEINKRYGSKI